MRFLLDRQGIAAEAVADAEVVLATDSLFAAGREVAAAKALYPGVEIVVVSDGGASNGAADLTVHDKWEGMEGVVEHVSAALGAGSASRPA